jgi:hypothetical protein
MYRISASLVLLVVLVGGAFGLWSLFKFLASQKGAERVGIFTMMVGAIGIVIPLLVLMGNSSHNIQIAVLISGAIIFGCGAIATAIGKTKE